MASKEAARKNNLNDRAHKVGIFDQDLSTQDVDAIIAFFDYTSCKSGIKPASSIDHVTPLSKGGQNIPENIQLLTTDENKGKGDDETDYRKGRICTREWVEQWKLENTTNKATKETYIKHDWDAIEHEYVTSVELPSLDTLAELYNVAPSHIRSQSKRLHWVEKRKNFRTELGLAIEQEAAKEEIDIRLEITRTTLDFLALWRQQNNKIGNADLIKVLELGARAYGLDLNKSTLVVKDWRDVAGEQGTDPDELEQYFSTLEGANVSGVEEGASAGWTD